MTAPGKRSYDRFCPLSLALDQVGDRWTLHVVLALLAGPKRYTQLKQHLAGAGANILSERLRSLAASHIVGRTAGDSPGTDITYHLTERGRTLAPVIGDLAMWGLSLMLPAPDSEIGEREVFDQAWTGTVGRPAVEETYEWTIDGVQFELAVRGSTLIRTRGPAAHPAVSFSATGATVADIARGQIAVAEAASRSDVRLAGSEEAIARMFAIVGFPLARLGF